MNRVTAMVVLGLGISLSSGALLTSISAAMPADTAPTAEETPIPLKPLCHFVDGEPEGTWELLQVDITTAAIHLDEHPLDFLPEAADSCALNPEPTTTPEPTVTVEPTATVEPTPEPTPEPTATSEPTAQPTTEPTVAPTPTPKETASAPNPNPTATPTPTAEVLGKTKTKELAETGFDGSDLAAIGLTVVAAGLVALWRSEEQLARGN